MAFFILVEASLISIANAQSNPHSPKVSAAHVSALPKDLQKIFLQRVTLSVYEKYQKIKTVKEFEEKFYAHLSEKERLEIQRLRPIKDLPEMSLRGDQLILKQGSLRLRIRFSNPLEDTVELNDRAWTYSRRISMLKNMDLIEERIKERPQASLLMNLLLPEAQAAWPVLAGMAFSAVATAVITGGINVSNLIFREGGCQWLQDSHPNAPLWRSLCRAWLAEQEAEGRAQLGRMDGLANFNLNRELRGQYELAQVACPRMEPDQPVEFRLRMRRSVLGAGSAEESARPWFNVLFKVRADGQADEVLITPDNVDPQNLKPTDRLVVRAEMAADNWFKNFTIENPFYDRENVLSRRQLTFTAQEVAARRGRTRNLSDAEVSITSQLNVAHEMLTYINERAKECQGGRGGQQVILTPTGTRLTPAPAPAASPSAR